MILIVDRNESHMLQRIKSTHMRACDVDVSTSHKLWWRSAVWVGMHMTQEEIGGVGTQIPRGEVTGLALEAWLVVLLATKPILFDARVSVCHVWETWFWHFCPYLTHQSNHSSSPFVDSFTSVVSTLNSSQVGGPQLSDLFESIFKIVGINEITKSIYDNIWNQRNNKSYQICMKMFPQAFNLMNSLMNEFTHISNAL